MKSPSLPMSMINRDLKEVIDSVKAYIELDKVSGISEFFVANSSRSPLKVTYA